RSEAPGLELEYVPITADIEEGDLLVSSGLGQRFPKDYPVAQVTSVVHDPGQPFAIIRARPLAQMDRTRHVMLVIPDDETIRGTPLIFENGEQTGLPAAVEEAAVTEVPAQTETPSSPEPAAETAVPAATGDTQ